MRTLELPDEVVERAEAEAKRRGITVEALATEALANAVPAPRRAKFPIIESDRPGFLDITPETLRQVEFEDDMRRSGLLD